MNSEKEKSSFKWRDERKVYERLSIDTGSGGGWVCEGGNSAYSRPCVWLAASSMAHNIPTSWYECSVQSPPLASWWDRMTHSPWIRYYKCDGMSLLSLGYKNNAASISLTLSFDGSERSWLTHCELLYERASWQRTDGSSQHLASTWATGESSEVDPCLVWPETAHTLISLVRDPEPEALGQVAAGFLALRNCEIVKCVLF